MERKKIFLYTIILTGTLLLITFCILSLIEKNTFKKYNSLNISYYQKGFMEENYGCSLEQFLETKKFTTIELTGNKKIDNKLLLKYQLKIRELVQKNDSISGVHLKLNKKTEYEEVIRAFDICEIEKAKVYIPYNYDIWVTNPATKEFKKKYPFKPKTQVRE
jgi:hypothetical protein